MRLSLLPGDPSLLGATPTSGGVNFALFSSHSIRVELLVFDETGLHELGRCDLPARDGEVWHGFAPKLQTGLCYGYRVHGPYAPERGHLFNGHKLLLDPYAKALVGQFEWGAEHFGYRLEGGNPDAGPDKRDNTRKMVKAAIVDPIRFSALARKPATSWTRSFIYELHAKGFTMRNPGIDVRERGKLAGLASTHAMEYLAALGITAIELLPIHSFIHDKFLVDQGLRNYWGYNTLNYFTPHRDYCLDDPIEEMRSFVNVAHDRNLEVLIDVVYNHTCEGSRSGPTLSFRGIDNAAYYRLNPSDLSQYDDISGCGATVDATKPFVRRLVVDSLAHWSSAYGVDGFRFDIATSLGLSQGGKFSNQAPIFEEIRANPVLKDAKLIAEPWDAAGGYQVGNFPADWGDWNGRARDTYRQFWRGDTDKARDLAKALAGSADLFRHKGKPVTASINFVACHDGFPTFDLTRYNHKHNEANGENNRDGGDHDFSCNYGHEGPSHELGCEELRERQVRNMLASAVLSFGTPMLLAGDEFGRTQGGNNNAYAQDNMVSWLDWSLPFSARGSQQLAFAKKLVTLRAKILDGLPEGAPNGPGELEPTIAWWSVWGTLMDHNDWMNPATQCFAALIEPNGWLLLINASLQDALFRAPPCGNHLWREVLSTAHPNRPESNSFIESSAIITLPARSLMVFQRDMSRYIKGNGHGF